MDFLVRYDGLSGPLLESREGMERGTLSGPTEVTYFPRQVLTIEIKW